MPLHSEFVAANSVLLSAAMYLAPTGATQREFSKLVSNSRWADKSERELFLILLSALKEGVENNNWPVTDQDNAFYNALRDDNA